MQAGAERHRAHNYMLTSGDGSGDGEGVRGLGDGEGVGGLGDGDGPGGLGDGDGPGGGRGDGDGRGGDGEKSQGLGWGPLVQSHCRAESRQDVRSAKAVCRTSCKLNSLPVGSTLS
jgi:hypothetical protein